VLLQFVIQYRLHYWSRDFFDAFGRRRSRPGDGRFHHRTDRSQRAVDNYSGLADCFSWINRVASPLLALDHLEHDSQVKTQDVDGVSNGSG